MAINYFALINCLALMAINYFAFLPYVLLCPSYDLFTLNDLNDPLDDPGPFALPGRGLGQVLDLGQVLLGLDDGLDGRLPGRPLDDLELDDGLDGHLPLRPRVRLVVALVKSIFSSTMATGRTQLMKDSSLDVFSAGTDN